MADRLESRDLEDIAMLLCVWTVLQAIRVLTLEGQAPRYRPAGVITTLVAPELGSWWTNIMLSSPPEYSYTTTRLRQPVLKALVSTLMNDYGLTHGRKVSAAEQVVIFLNSAAHKTTNNRARQIYQHSPLTIRRAILKVSRLCCQLHTDIVIQPDRDAITPSAIVSNPKLWPYLSGCIGALDGSHVPFKPKLVENAGAYRNRKGGLSQNVLACCDFDGYYTFVLPGWEGSANDGTVLRDALRKGMYIPSGRYYLADGGYSKNLAYILVPYQKTRYHLREWLASEQKPETKEELFNLRHSQLRNMIERNFGIDKERWPILRDGPNKGYSALQQSRFVCALLALHNFILRNGQPVESEEFTWQPPNIDVGFDEASIVEDTIAETDRELMAMRSKMSVYRDKVATSMWRDYRERLEANKPYEND